MSNEGIDLEEILKGDEEEQVQTATIIRDLLSSSNRSVLNRYTDLTEKEIYSISFLEAFVKLVDSDFDMRFNFLSDYLTLIKEHKVSKGRKGRSEIIRALTSVAEEEKKKTIFEKLLGR